MGCRVSIESITRLAWPSGPILIPAALSAHGAGFLGAWALFRLCFHALRRNNHLIPARPEPLAADGMMHAMGWDMSGSQKLCPAMPRP